MGTFMINNNAYGTLASGIGAGDTTITLTAGQGARFPAISSGAGDWGFATLQDASNNIEIVKITNRTGDSLTVVRAQESTSARAWAPGDIIEQRLTAATAVTVDGTQTLTAKTLVTPALGTPVSGTLTNCTGLPQAGTVGLTTADSPQFASVNVGHATDTTITRASAGVIAVEGVTIPLNSTTSIHTAQQIELGNVSDTTLTRVSPGVVAVEGVNILTTATGALKGANSDITSLAGLTTPLSVAQGGTGSATLNTCTLTGNQSVAGIKTFSDTTDASDSVTGGTVISGGLAVAKKIIAGTSVEAPSMKSGSGSTSALTSTWTTLFTATAGMYIVSMRLPDAGVNYLAASIFVFDTAAGTELVSGQSASGALQVSGMNVQGHQASGGTTNIAWSFLKII